MSDSMDQKVLREREAKCVQESPPGCTAGCPLHVDVRGMIAAVRKNDYAAGSALLKRMVPFPSIISRICDQPCQISCERSGIGGPVAIRDLERVCVDNDPKRSVAVMAQPLKHRKIAIIGAGLSGLTAALELAKKGYQVIVFEAMGQMGGIVRELPANILSPEAIEEDLAVFSRLPVEICYHTTIGSSAQPLLTSLCNEFDAVYLAIGWQSDDFVPLDVARDADGQIVIDPLTLATSYPKLFSGGSIRRKRQGRSPTFSICDGKIAALSIDRLLQGASLTANREKEGPYQSNLYTRLDGILPQPPTTMTQPSTGYSREEAAMEANRCLQCECLECVKACEYLSHYRSYPKRYVREIYNNIAASPVK